VKVQVAHGAWGAGLGGYYFDDLIAVRKGAEADGFVYRGAPVTAGHAAIRNPGRVVVTQLVDEDGCIGYGDAAAIQYSGVVGRDPVLAPELHGPQVDVAIAHLTGAGAIGWEEGCRIIEGVEVAGARLHTGIRYGLSQALLGLVAAHHRTTMADVVAHEFDLGEPASVPIFGQCGDERRRNVDKMILKQLDALPHGLINAPALFGADGATLLEYARWVRDRVVRLGSDGYHPTLHFDVYGLAGFEFSGDVDRIARFCDQLARACEPFPVRLETPIDAGSTAATSSQLAALRQALVRGGVPVALVADDWCNTIEDVELFIELQAADMIQVKTPDLGALSHTVEAALRCRRGGMQVFVGGTCNETDVSSRATVHVAAALRADLIYAKPGMGVDEGTMIVRNELVRLFLENAGRGH
jgi:methylaspartate ammonia-lyase